MTMRRFGSVSTKGTAVTPRHFTKLTCTRFVSFAAAATSPRFTQPVTSRCSIAPADSTPSRETSFGQWVKPAYCVMRGGMPRSERRFGQASRCSSVSVARAVNGSSVSTASWPPMRRTRSFGREAIPEKSAPASKPDPAPVPVKKPEPAPVFKPVFETPAPASVSIPTPPPTPKVTISKGSAPAGTPLTVSTQASAGAAASGNTHPANILALVSSGGWPVTDLSKDNFSLMEYFEVPGQQAPFSNNITSFRNVGTGAYLI